MKEYNNSNFNIVLPIVIALSVITGIVIAELLNKDNTASTILIPQTKDKLNMVIDYVENEYVDKISREELAEIAIPKFLEELDPHTIYFTAEEAKGLDEELEGNFQGIGIQFNIFRDTVLVVSTIKDGPSEKQGLLAGDRIVKVNDTIIAGVGITNDLVMKKLKGPSGSIVSLKIWRKGHKELIPIKISRGNVPLRSVDAYYMVDKEIGYVKISTFSSNTHNQFVEAIFAMKKSGIKSVIIDLRNNAGGYLNSATNITDEFLESGKLLVYTEGQARPRKTTTSTTKRSACLDLEVVVLIDEFSASASEILAGAIQDNDRGFIIGRRSYGKGLVQEATTFDDGSVIRLTTARYYTPSGRSIQKPYGKGLDEYYADIYNRYAHGEFSEKDSIIQNDSLIFHTSKGRPVYGGGGIMPDIFVPIDTSNYTNLVRDINKKNLEYIFSITYVDNNRERMKKIVTLKDLKQFLVNDNAIDKFYAYILKNGVKINPRDKSISGKLIENDVYSYIARQTIGENAFYEIINSLDPTMDTAILVLKQKRKL
jgi:carboxyl-terminal processing protease